MTVRAKKPCYVQIEVESSLHKKLKIDAFTNNLEMRMLVSAVIKFIIDNETHYKGIINALKPLDDD
ncbi:MAG: hypothetical protein ACYC9R_12145 [Nitrosotalea sp.]